MRSQPTSASTIANQQKQKQQYFDQMGSPQDTGLANKKRLKGLVNPTNKLNLNQHESSIPIVANVQGQGIMKAN